VRADKSASFLDSEPWMPFGLSRLFPKHRGPEASSFAWEPGDRILLYADGLAEARDATGEFLPLIDLAPDLQSGSLDAALDGLLSRVQAHVPRGALHDDLAVVLLEHAPAAGESWDRTP
jgi:sigma-B regulation protein RsbU (phosphoserine phosphatase)